MEFKFNWTSFLMGAFIGAASIQMIAVFSETPEDRHARQMEEIKEFAAMAPLAVMIFKAQNGN
jgi:hypothetical protein